MNSILAVTVLSNHVHVHVHPLNDLNECSVTLLFHIKTTWLRYSSSSIVRKHPCPSKVLADSLTLMVGGLVFKVSNRKLTDRMILLNMHTVHYQMSNDRTNVLFRRTVQDLRSVFYDVVKELEPNSPGEGLNSLKSMTPIYRNCIKY